MSEPRNTDHWRGTREERLYHCQSWRGDVVRLIASTGVSLQAEGARFSSFGVPFGLPFGDTDGDGDSDIDDQNFIALRSGDRAQYDIRGDLDLDGVIDVFDESLFSIFGGAPALGPGALSNLESRKGYAGYEHDGGINALAHVRRRAFATDEGRWTRRDPAGYDDGANLYEYVGGNPLTATDAMGLAKGVPTRSNPNLDANIRCLYADTPDDGTGSGGAATQPCQTGGPPNCWTTCVFPCFSMTTAGPSMGGCGSVCAYCGISATAFVTCSKACTYAVGIPPLHAACVTTCLVATGIPTAAFCPSCVSCLSAIMFQCWWSCC